MHHQPLLARPLFRKNKGVVPFTILTNTAVRGTEMMMNEHPSTISLPIPTHSHQYPSSQDKKYEYEIIKLDSHKEWIKIEVSSIITQLSAVSPQLRKRWSEMSRVDIAIYIYHIIFHIWSYGSRRSSRTSTLSRLTAIRLRARRSSSSSSSDSRQKL